MKVAIGAVAGTVGGPATYAIELVAALAEAGHAADITVLTDRPDAFVDGVRTVEVPLTSPWHQPVWDQVGIARALAAGGYDLYHGTKGALPLASATPSVVTVHDLANYTQPSTFRFAQRLHLGFETPHAVARARLVLTVSEHSARDIVAHFPSAADRVVVVYSGPGAATRSPGEDEIEAYRRAHAIDGPVVGYLGTVQPRKNIDLLASAFLRAAGTQPWRLLVAGRLRPGFEPDFLSDPDPRIEYLGAIPADEVPLFLSAIDCMVSPSSYEGFGLSFLEAMRVGCPVIGLAHSSVPEVVGDAGVLLDRLDEAVLAEAITQMIDDPSLRSEYSRRGRERAARFTWEASARATWAAYEKALSR